MAPRKSRASSSACGGHSDPEGLQAQPREAEGLPDVRRGHARGADQPAVERRSFVGGAREVQAGRARTFDAIKEAGSISISITPPKEPSARQNKARREKQKALRKQAKSAAKSGSEKQNDREAKVSRDSRVLEKVVEDHVVHIQREKVMRMVQLLARLQVRRPMQVRTKCVQCGGDHPYHGNH